MPETARRAKIVCTLGPASRSRSVLRALVRAGMDVARLNFSHGEPEEHEETLDRLRAAAREEGRTVAVLQDLQGPKIRIGRVDPSPLRLKRGDRLALTVRGRPTGPEAVTVSYRKLPADLRRGDRVLIDDGLIQLEVERTTADTVHCRVVEGGDLTSRKGVNLPGRKLSLPSLTAKDRRDLDYGIAWGVDYIALSFVREARDVEAVKRVLRARDADIPVIAKLEKPQAVENLAGILDHAEGIMVARGDLGVELPPERVPVLQKRMIRMARLAGKPVITATQMLESMVEHRRPTRAEASDVANAIFDGTDAVMLSAETATGRYPVETVKMMARIIRAAEGSRSFRPGPVAVDPGPGASPGAGGEAGAPEPPHVIADGIAEAAARAARDLDARVIAVFTQSGGTARVVSKHRPLTPIYAFTPVERVERRLALLWGVEPRPVDALPTTDEMVDTVVAELRRKRVVKTGDLIVVTAGSPVNTPGTTNFMKIHRVERGS